MKKYFFIAVLLIFIFSSSISLFAFSQQAGFNYDKVLTQTQINKAITYYKNNCSKSEIISLQSQLNKASFDCGKPDGVAGEKTVIAVATFQKSKNLKVDGIAGKETKELLGITDASNNNTQGIYLVKLKDAYLEYNNSVGNEWQFGAYIDNRNIYIGDTIEISNKSKMTVKVEVTENDKYPDYGSNKQTINLSDVLANKGGTFSLSATVKENRGRYSGNTAKWVFIFEVSLKN